MKKIIASTVVLLLVATVAWAASNGSSSLDRDCLTSADLLRHQANSRTGISLSCTPEMIDRAAQGATR